MKYAQFEELKTARLNLRRVRLEDAPDYYERVGRREAVTRYMFWEPHTDIGVAKASIEKVLRRYEMGKCYRWAIASGDDDRLIGIIELLKFDEEHSTCSFAYMLGDDYWGKGYGTEALKAALCFAFRKLELDAVEGEHFGPNAASGAVMRKAGMKYIGTELRKYEKNGEVFDVPQYRITRKEWENSIS